MIDLLQIRDQIDEVDSEIVALFEKRMSLTSEVADYKIKTDKPVFDKEREVLKLEVLRKKATSEFNAKGVQELFQQIMSISRKRQYQLLTENGIAYESEFTPVDELDIKGGKVVFQGMEGAYSYAAMNSFFGKDIDSYHVETWKETMEDICTGKAKYAVLPIENSTAGAVTDIYDLLDTYEHIIVGEQVIRVEHVLMGLCGAALNDVRTVYSHPQSLMQCKTFLGEHPQWQQEKLLNNAFAAKKVKDDGDITQAAIASAYAAEYFGLDILAQNFHSDTNETRFIIISREKIYTRNGKKITICFELPHASGTLYNILAHFIYNNLSMTKIESRPIRGKNWEYRFFVDFEGNLDDDGVRNALRGIEQEVSKLRILGNY